MGKTNLVPLYEREKIPRPKTVRQTGYGDGVGRCVVLRSLNNRALLFHGCSDPLPEFRPPPPQRDASTGWARACPITPPKLQVQFIHLNFFLEMTRVMRNPSGVNLSF